MFSPRIGKREPGSPMNLTDFRTSFTEHDDVNDDETSYSRGVPEQKRASGRARAGLRSRWKIGIKLSMHQILPAESALARHEYQVARATKRPKMDGRPLRIRREYRACRFPSHFRISRTFLRLRPPARQPRHRGRLNVRYKPLASGFNMIARDL